MKKHVTLWFVFLLLFTAAQGHADEIRGRWRVYTTLVTAYDAVNPDYVPGDRRLETWRFAVAGRRATLRTPAGIIRGVRVGKAWVFDQTYPVYYPVSANFLLVARLRGVVLRGTIEVRYYDDRFGPGYILGNDAWTFRGTRP
jgi:hypothetical protein